MTQIEQVKAEIERRLNGYDPDYTSAGKELEALLLFIDSLPAEQSENIGKLEEEYKRFKNSTNDGVSGLDIARYFAEWGAEQLKKEAIFVQVVGDKRDLRLVNPIQRCAFNAKRGDWLNIIILKEDEESL